MFHFPKEMARNIVELVVLGEKRVGMRHAQSTLKSICGRCRSFCHADHARFDQTATLERRFVLLATNTSNGSPSFDKRLGNESVISGVMARRETDNDQAESVPFFCHTSIFVPAAFGDFDDRVHDARNIAAGWNLHKRVCWAFMVDPCSPYMSE